MKTDTVFIIDYAARFSEQIFLRLRDYSTKALDHKVRILLIEREIDGVWWKQFQNSLEVNVTSFQASPLILKGLTIDNLISIVREVIRLQDKKCTLTNDEVRLQLYRFDFQLRPLFAMFLGNALADNQDLTEWNQDDLLSHQLHRQSITISGKYKDLDNNKLNIHLNWLVFSTICYGLPKKELIELLDKSFNWLPAKAEFNYSLYTDLANSYDVELDNGIAPLLPDILGEFFVLESFNDDRVNPFKDLEKSQQLMQATGQFSRGLDYFFLRRVFQDFPTHPNIIKLLSSNFYNGSLGKDILYLMHNVFFAYPDAMKKLWECTQSLSTIHGYDEDRRIYMDDPHRIFQEASVIMLNLHKNDLQTQLIYYRYIKQTTDKFILFPNEIHTMQPDRKGPSEMTPEEARAAFNKPTEAQLKLMQEDVVIWADIPHLECEGIGMLITSYLSLLQKEQAMWLMKRLETLNEKFTDPRTKIVILLIYFKFYKDDESLIDIKIANLFTRIKNTPRQVPVIDVTNEKRIFLLMISQYYIKERKNVEIAKRYYTELFEHFLTLPDHPMYLNGKLGMTDNAGFLFELCFENDDLESCKWYLNQIITVRNAFNGHGYSNIDNMISELSKKIG